MVVGLWVLGQIIRVGLHHAAWLLPELPGIRAGHALLLGHVVPPVVVIHRVGVHDDAVPGSAPIALGRVAANTVGESVDHSLWQFSRLVDPGTRELEREQLPDILWLVERQENHLHVDPSRAIAGRQADVVGDGRCPQHRAEGGLWEQIQPGLDGGGLEHRVAVTHHRPAAVFDIVNRGRLLLDSLDEDLAGAAVALPRPHGPHQSLHKGVGLDEVVDDG